LFPRRRKEKEEERGRGHLRKVTYLGGGKVCLSACCNSLKKKGGGGGRREDSGVPKERKGRVGVGEKKTAKSTPADFSLKINGEKRESDPDGSRQTIWLVYGEKGVLKGNDATWE